MPTTRTLAPAVSIGNYPQTGRVTVEERIAKRLGCTPGTAHQWMYGEQRANKRAAAIRRAMLDCGERERADKWVATIEQAGLREIPQLTIELFRLTRDAIALHGIANDGYVMDACERTARLLVKAIDCLRHRLLEKRAALVHRWGLEI